MKATTFAVTGADSSHYHHLWDRTRGMRSTDPGLTEVGWRVRYNMLGATYELPLAADGRDHYTSEVEAVTVHEAMITAGLDADLITVAGRVSRLGRVAVDAEELPDDELPDDGDDDPWGRHGDESFSLAYADSSA